VGGSYCAAATVCDSVCQRLPKLQLQQFHWKDHDVSITHNNVIAPLFGLSVLVDGKAINLIVTALLNSRRMNSIKNTEIIQFPTASPLWGLRVSTAAIHRIYTRKPSKSFLHIIYSLTAKRARWIAERQLAMFTSLPHQAATRTKMQQWHARLLSGMCEEP
jgi:hypothetical protein